MIQGRAGLSGFDSALADAGRMTEGVTAELQDLNARMLALRAEVAEAYAALARLRLSEAAGAAATGPLDAVGQAVQRLATARAEAIASADAALATARRGFEAARAARSEARTTLDALEDQAEAAASAVQGRLAQDAEWQRLDQAAQAAEAIALHAEQKTALAQADRVRKGKPYEDDPLFAYLWARGWGTPAYRAGPVTRLIDGFVARVARYEPARRNYAMLTDLPVRLGTHAARMREAASQAASARSAHEARLAQAAGGPAAAALEQARARFEAAEDAAEAAESALRTAQAQAAAAAAGDDAGAQAAIAEIESALQRQDIASLRAAAARTPSPEDDAIVVRIERAEAERWRLAQEIEARRAVLEDARRRAAEAEALKREYRRRGYGGGQFDMGNAMLGALLGQVLSGALGRDRFFERMEQSRRADPWARGGANPWGRPPAGGGSMGGGGMGGGGFRTGGTMGGGGGGGGGGFKTGGGV